MPVLVIGYIPTIKQVSDGSQAAPNFNQYSLNLREDICDFYEHSNSIIPKGLIRNTTDVRFSLIIIVN